MLLYLIKRCALAEAGDVDVSSALLASGSRQTGVVGGRDALDVVVGQIAAGAVDHAAHFPGVDEQGAATAVAAVPSEEPQTGGYLGGPEELAREGNMMQSTRSASIRFLRISPSPDWFDDMEPLERTKPAVPRGARW